MNTIRNIFAFVYAIDKAMWHDNINTTRYFGTLSLWSLFFMGIETTRVFMEGGGYYEDYYNYYSGAQGFIGALGMFAVIYTMNIAESIMAAKKGNIALVRSLMLLLPYLVFFVLGLLIGKSVILAKVVTVLLIIYAIAFIVVEIVAAFKKEPEKRDGAALFDFEQPDSQPRFCGQCGARLTPGHQFCGQCGHRIGL